MRYPEAAERTRGSYFAIMREAFMHKAQALGYEVIDLDPWFLAHYTAHGERFEHPRDGHWNSLGHGVAAEAVMSSKLLGRLRAP
jgi:hypothetical protein